MRNKLIYISYFILSILFLNIAFSLVVYHQIDMRFIMLILFSILSAIELISILLLFKMNRLLSYITIIFISVLYIANYIYFSIYDSVVSIASMMQGKQVLEFYDVILEILLKALPMMIVFLIPMIFFIIIDYKKVIEFKINTIKLAIILIFISIFFRGLLLLVVNVNKTLENRYYHSSLVNIAKDFGLLEELKVDISTTFLDSNKEIDEEEEKPIEKEKEYNLLNIDFKALIDKTTNQDLIKMYTYFDGQQPTEKNDYTGIFKGKNLIVFVAEALVKWLLEKMLLLTYIVFIMKVFNLRIFILLFSQLVQRMVNISLIQD
jgi:lipoteichoic acid synthase